MFGAIGAGIASLLSFGKQKSKEEGQPTTPAPVHVPHVLRVTLKSGVFVDFTESHDCNLLYRVDKCGSLTIFQIKPYPYGIIEKKLCTYSPGFWELVHPRDNE